MLQICNIVQILYQGGYSHADLHPGNIMVTKTNKKYFKILDHQVPYENYQLVAIDYGLVMHKKFGVKYNNEAKNFLTQRKNYAFNETFYSCIFMMNNFSKMMDDCDKQNKLLPWERKINTNSDATKKMLLKHPDFYKLTSEKYGQLYPMSKNLLKYVNDNVNSVKSVNDLVHNKKYEYEFWQALNRIIEEFALFFPQEFSTYWRWCSQYEYNLPKHIVLKILEAKTIKEFVEFLINQINK
jgi:predicted unusual protein kinase regulating ubiquinone biosynthesis (AarF/ABC1/UbiB family)